MYRHKRLVQLEDYAPFIGAESVERIRQKAKPLQGFHVAHVNPPITAMKAAYQRFRLDGIGVVGRLGTLQC